MGPFLLPSPLFSFFPFVVSKPQEQTSLLSFCLVLSEMSPFRVDLHVFSSLLTNSSSTSTSSGKEIETISSSFCLESEQTLTLEQWKDIILLRLDEDQKQILLLPP